MRELAITAVEPISEDTLTAVRLALREQRTLTDVLTWLRVSSPPRMVAEIVTQDEYTHDVVVQYAEACWLAFDTT